MESLPSRGAWIETMELSLLGVILVLRAASMVAPLAGGVD